MIVIFAYLTLVITFRVRHSQGENGRGCPLVVHSWADLQSVPRFRCYDNIAPNAKCQRVLVVALCLVNCIGVAYVNVTIDCLIIALSESFIPSFLPVFMTFESI